MTIFTKYLKVLSIIYAFGFLLHLSDILNLRLHFSEMNSTWKSWIIYLLIFDGLAAVYLCKGKKLGEYFFILIAVSQIFAYSFYKGVFGNQMELICFHIICLFLYFILSHRHQRELKK